MSPIPRGAVAISLTILALLCFPPSNSAAQSVTARDEAAAHSANGEAAHDRGEYQAAVNEYGLALKLARQFDPREPSVECSLLNNLSRCNEKAGNIDQAIKEARQLLTECKDVEPRERDEHEGRVARMLGTLKPAITIAAPDTSRPRAMKSPVGGIVLAAIGGGLLVASIACAASLPAAEGKIQGSLTLAEIDSLSSQVRGLQGAAIGLGAAGAALGAGGVALIVLSRRGQPR